MVESLNGQAVGRYRLHVEIVGRPRYVDQRDFALYLIDPDGRRSHEPLFRGRWNAGRPSSHVPTWIDGEFAPAPFPPPQDEGEQLREGDSLFGEVAQCLGALIPAGGRLWLAYESFGTENWLYCETRAALAAQVPAEATPIGLLLVRARGNPRGKEQIPNVPDAHGGDPQAGGGPNGVVGMGRWVPIIRGSGRIFNTVSNRYAKMGSESPGGASYCRIRRCKLLHSRPYSARRAEATWRLRRS